MPRPMPMNPPSRHLTLPADKSRQASDSGWFNGRYRIPRGKFPPTRRNGNGRRTDTDISDSRQLGSRQRGLARGYLPYPGEGFVTGNVIGTATVAGTVTVPRNNKLSPLRAGILDEKKEANLEWWRWWWEREMMDMECESSVRRCFVLLERERDT